MFQNIKEDFRLFKQSKKHILLFEISYKLLAAAVIYPLVFALVNVGMKMAGISYLTNEYILRTVTSPYVIASVLLVLLAAVIYCAYEMSFMLAAYEYKRRDADVTFYATAFSALRKMKRFVKLKNLPMILFYLLAVVFVNVTILANLIFTQTNRNLFRIHILNGKWWLKLILIVVVLLIYAIVFIGIYSFHVFYLEDKSFTQAFKKSFRMVRTHPIRTIGSIVFYNFIVLLLIGLVYGLMSLILIAGVRLLDMAYMGSAVYLSVLKNVQVAVKVALCCIAVPASFLVLTRHYYMFVDIEDIDYPLIYLKERYVKFHKITYGVVIIATAVSLVVNIVESFNHNPFERIAIFHETQITSHRGASLQAPENTLAAFQQAMDDFADYIELDVQMTSDGVLVIMHDDNTLRTTGVDNKISNMTLAEVKRLDAGSWFSEEFAGEKVPTLEEVLELTNGRIKINIEIKAGADGITIARKVAELVEEYHAENQCVVTSFDHSTLIKVKQCNENIRVGYILSVAYGSFYQMEDVDFFSMNASFLTKRTVDAIHNSGKEVYAWTVNNEDAIRNLTNKGVDNIITDNPVLAAETVYSRNTSETMLNMLKYVFNQ